MTEYHQQDYYAHTFRTTAGVDRFHAIVAKACKQKTWIEIEALDRSYVPFTRVFAVTFSSIEDRDRVRIAMRFVDPDAQPSPTAGQSTQLARA